MNAGDTAYQTVNNVLYQVALFPLDYLNCTQLNGAGTYSHCCGTMTDWAGPSTSYPYYAPVDCHRLSLSGSDNVAMYKSDSKVLTPSGVKWLCFLFMHDNNVPSQTSFRQGQLIGHTGVAGNVTGDHVHLDQCLQSTISLQQSGQACAGTSDCWYVPNGVQPTAAYYLTGAEQIVNLRGQTFQTAGSYNPGGVSGDAGLIWFIIGKGAGRKKWGFRR
jgi:hypothetical protein